MEFVTYKWPEWLRRQSEKQRIIWGYKILFLDVLFPLHVDKIIYVDADQVRRVREMKERGGRGREGDFIFVFCSIKILQLLIVTISIEKRFTIIISCLL